MFGADEIDSHRSDPKTWHDWIRRREAEITFSVFPDRRFRLALELGAGNGGQSVTIARYCDKLICTEVDASSHAWHGKTILERQVPNVEYMLCDAQDLSRFDDDTFDLVFSSNMLEHIPDVRKCLQECRRVLRADGVMLHAMPSRWWKLFYSGLHIAQLRPPDIHGISASQWQEFRAFGAGAWTRLIESIGLEVTEIIGLPFYVGHGNRFIPIIKAGNALRLCASYLYVIEKSGHGRG